MQQTGYCPRGPFCAFAHVDRKYPNVDLIYNTSLTVLYQLM